MNFSTIRSFLLFLTLASLAGCGGSSPPAPPMAPFTTDAALQGTPVPKAVAITLDGDTADWPASSVIVASDRYIYVRFAVQDAQYTLQAAPITTAIMLDVDGEKSTGRVGSSDPLNSLGVDLEIDFSPPRGPGVSGHGVAAFTLDAAGNKTPISTADFDFSASPTYAANWYECRISRTPSNTAGLPKLGMLSRGWVKGVVATLDSNGQVDGATEPFTVNAGPAAPGKYLAIRDLPVKPDGAIRVMEYNVEKSNPTSKPELFRRLFKAAKPDVILLEEWETGDAVALQAWFTSMVSNDTWNVVKPAGNNSTGGGVAIVTHLPLAPMADDRLVLPPGAVSADSKEHKIRFVCGKITTPVGDMLVGCVHLKCCGSKDSPEDQTRMAEARAINACFKAGAGTDKATIRLLAGDLNLVGSRPPLDLLRQGLDSDGSDLAIASPMVLGDATLQTWRDPTSGYCAGRLDYVTYSHTNCQIVNAFVLDTSRLSDESLAKMGLERGDCDGSDHLPVIVDIRPIVH